MCAARPLCPAMQPSAPVGSLSIARAWSPPSKKKKGEKNRGAVQLWSMMDDNEAPEPWVGAIEVLHHSVTVISANQYPKT